MTDALTRRAPPDLIGATVVFSLLLHAIVILGVTFHYVRAAPGLPTLDVTLVQVANRQAPDKADFLAQASNQGGGENQHSARPSQPVAGPLPTPDQGTAARPVDAAVPSPRQATPQRMVTTTGATERSVVSDTAQVQRDTAADAEELRQQQEVARLTAELRDRTEAYAKRPKKKFISASTKEYAYAAYMRGWVDRVERVGNLNYPQEARRRGLHGELELTVTLDRTGQIKAIDVTRSSGQPILDRAAAQIVRLAAPFPPIPTTENVDELHITRTWQFLPGDILRNR